VLSLTGFPFRFGAVPPWSTCSVFFSLPTFFPPWVDGASPFRDFFWPRIPLPPKWFDPFYQTFFFHRLGRNFLGNPPRGLIPVAPVTLFFWVHFSRVSICLFTFPLFWTVLGGGGLGHRVHVRSPADIGGAFFPRLGSHLIILPFSSKPPNGGLDPWGVVGLRKPLFFFVHKTPLNFGQDLGQIWFPRPGFQNYQLSPFLGGSPTLVSV